MIFARSAAPAARFARGAAAALAGSALLYLSAQIAVPANPFWGVPFTLQTLAIPVLVALLGRDLAVCAVVAYLLEGASGLPVFQGHAGGLARFVGPTATTAGYLLAFPFAAYAIGTLYRAGLGRRYLTRFAAALAGAAIVIGCGALALYGFFFHDAAATLAAGVAPFVAAEVLKAAVAAAVPPRETL